MGISRISGGAPTGQKPSKNSNKNSILGPNMSTGTNKKGKGASKAVESEIFSKEQLTEYQRAFRIYDPDDVGQIDAINLKNALRAVGFEPKSDEIKQLVKKMIPKDAGGKLTFDQFLDIIRQKTVESDTKVEIIKAFELFDEQNSGRISVENLRHIADELGESVSDQELKEMITEADIDKDGFVNRDEFYRIMKKTGLY